MAKFCVKTGFRRYWLKKISDKTVDQRDQDTQKGTDHDLYRGVADKFFQLVLVGHFFAHDLQNLHYFIENLCLFASF